MATKVLSIAAVPSAGFVGEGCSQTQRLEQGGRHGRSSRRRTEKRHPPRIASITSSRLSSRKLAWNLQGPGRGGKASTAPGRPGQAGQHGSMRPIALAKLMIAHWDLL
jgi:hypothetical protein